MGPTVEGGNIVWDLDAKTTKLDQKLKDAQSKIGDTARTIDKGLGDVADRIGKRLDNVASGLDDVGNRLIKIGAAPTLALGLASNAAITFEDSLADVRKSTGLTADETAKLGSALLDLSKNTRTSNASLLDIAKIGGQLGVAQSQLLPFIESVNQAVVALGDEFTGGAEEVTRELGVLSNQFKLSGKDGEFIAEAITRVGSALNSLGASGQATAPYITDFSRRVGGIAPVVGLSIDKVLGLGAALQELGQSQEVAGTAIQSLLVTMGKNVKDFAAIAGVSGKEFSRLLKEDINEALLLVAQGVTKDADGIEELSERLDGLGIDGQRTVAVLANLGNNTDLVRKRQALAAAEYAKGTSILTEYNIKNETTAANVAKLRNNISAMAVTLGTALLPQINANIERMIPFVQAFADFTANNPQVVGAILGIGAALGGLGVALKVVSVAVSGLVPLLTVAKVAFIGLGNAASLSLGLGLVKNLTDAGAAMKLFGGAARLAMLGAAQSVATFGAALLANPITWIILAIVAVIGVFYLAWRNNWFGVRDITDSVVASISKNVESLKGVLGSVAKYFQAVIESGDWGNDWAHTDHMPQMLADTIREIGKFIVFVQGVPAKITAIASTIGPALSNFGNQVVTFFSNLPQMIGNFFAALPVIIGNYFIITAEKIAYQLGYMLGLVIYGVPKIVDAIVGFFSALPAQLSDLWDLIAINIQLTWINIGAWLNVTIPNIINSIGAFFANLPTLILGALVLSYNWVTIKFTEIWNWLNAVVPQIIASVANFFWELPGQLANMAVAAKDALVNGFVEAWNALVGEISTWPSKLYDWGAKIVSSFADGIKSAVGRIADAFRAGMNDAKSDLEGHSPPVTGPFKNIDKWGMAVGQAWVTGFKGAFSGVDKQLFGGMSMQSPTLAVNGGGYNGQVASPNSGGQNITIRVDNMNVRDDSDIETMARVLGFRIQTTPGFNSNG